MVTKGKKTKPSKRMKAPYKAGLHWVLNNLTEAKLSDLDRRAPTDETIMEFFLGCVDAGIDVKITHDVYSDCYTAIAVGSWEGFPSEGFATSGRSARDPSDALAILWYKVVVLADGDLSSIPTEDKIDSLRG